MSKVTRRTLRSMKRKGEKITVLTAYDHAFGRIVDRAGIDVILVGDSLGNVVQGLESTIPVTLEEMIYHARMVARAAERALVVCDMPFMSFQVSPGEALRNAGRILKETGCEAVKLEGGRVMAETVERITAAGIPVMGHVGLTPQSVHQLGGYRVPGKQEKAAEGLLQDALALERAGAFAVVLECTPAELSRRISEKLKIPTIGIGAGPHCDGQVLVLHDALGMNEGHVPSFVRRFAELGAAAREGVEGFARAVRSGEYPAGEHSF